jgi:hypothetical protein
MRRFDSSAQRERTGLRSDTGAKGEAAGRVILPSRRLQDESKGKYPAGANRIYWDVAKW